MERQRTRLTIIKKLNEIHPGIISSHNPKIAHYTGGMMDSGELNWEYCLFEATIEELQEALESINLNSTNRLGNVKYF